MALDRNLHGRRWDRDICLCLTLWCRSPRGYGELRNSKSVIFQKLKSNKNERILATHVLPLVFLGSTGSRFTFAHFATDTASGHKLHLLIRQSVNMLLNFGFKIQYISTDKQSSL